jgi:hypothetical protein
VAEDPARASGRSQLDRPDRPDLPDWHDISYLRSGGARQRRAFRVLDDLGILRDLARFGATLVGTIPIAVDLPDSDLDIICRAPEPAAFEAALRDLYATRAGFRLERTTTRGRIAVVVNFSHAGEAIEVFGQDQDVDRQAGFRHMVVEARLLGIGGERMRRGVIALKLRGMATEPAFAELLGLSGDPYERMLDLHGATDAELAALVGDGSAREGDGNEERP